MKFLIAVCLFCVSFAAFGEDASLAGTTSVLVTSDKSAQEAKTVTAAVAASDECSSSDCRVRRRALGRGYVVVKHSVSGNTTTSTREVVDNCCNTVRAKTVTKTKCDCCRDCKCNRCNCK